MLLSTQQKYSVCPEVYHVPNIYLEGRVLRSSCYSQAVVIVSVTYPDKILGELES